MQAINLEKKQKVSNEKTSTQAAICKTYNNRIEPALTGKTRFSFVSHSIRELEQIIQLRKKPGLFDPCS